MWKRPIVNTAVQVSAKAVMVLITLVTTGILTRKLGVLGYGNFVLINSIFLLLDAIADMGTRVIGVREASTAETKEAEDRVYREVWKLRLITTGVAWAMGLGLILIWSGLSGLRWEAVVALSMSWLTMLAGNMEMVFQKRLRMDLKSVMDVAFPLLFMTAILFWPGNVTLLWVVSGYWMARLLSLLIGWELIKKIGGVANNIKIKPERVKEFLKLSWPMGIYLLIFTAYDRAVDSLMIRHFFSAAEVGWYGLAYKVYGNLLQPAYFFVSNIFPLLSSKNHNKKELFKVGGTILLAGALVVVAIIWALAPWIVQVLAGSGYDPAIGVLRGLLIALVFSYLGHLVGFTLISEGGQRDMLGLGVVNLVVNIGLNWWAIPRFGIMGATGVTVITEATGLLLMSWKLWQRRSK